MNDYRELHELYHFGILGMHWGVRRYQNPDGTLTAAGKKRYDQKMSKVKMYENAKNTAASGYQYYNMPASAKISGNYLDEQIKRARKDAEKYGTETPEERKATIERHRQEALERNKQKIEEANKIDLKDVKNKIPMKETKDKWEKAAKEDTYDLDFLEITQNDYDEMPEESAKKQRLKDYSDYLNAHKVSTMVIDKHKQSKELDDAAYLGMKAFMANGAGDEFQNFESEKEWFNYEDQTIGYTEVADLCKKMKKDGYGKDDVLNTLKSIDDNKFVSYFKGFNGNKEGLWDLEWFTGSEITGDYAQKNKSLSGKTVGEDYIDAIFAILESEGKIHHSAVDAIFEKFGII